MTLLDSFGFTAKLQSGDCRFKKYAARHKRGEQFILYLIDDRDFPAKSYCAQLVNKVEKHSFPCTWRAFYILSDASAHETFLCFERYPTLRQVREAYEISPEIGFYALLDILATCSYLCCVGERICRVCEDNFMLGPDLRCYACPAELAFVVAPADYGIAEAVDDVLRLYFTLVFGAPASHPVSSYKLPRLISNVLTVLQQDCDYRRVFSMRTVREILENRLGKPFFRLSQGQSAYGDADHAYKLVNGFSVDENFVEAVFPEGTTLEEALLSGVEGFC